MFCKNCGAELKENAVVCLNCGVAVGDGDKFCPNCGAKPDPLAVVCVKCGRPLPFKEQPQPVSQPVNKPKAESETVVVNSFGSAISSCFKKFAVFSGRANRAEFWWFFLFFLLLSWTFLGFVLLLPYLAVCVRRFHDSNHSGWWLFCPIYPIVLLFSESDPGTNDYGDNPN